ncbi:MAG: hypothetical protein HN348_32135 [Proteobacteria bacterium]|jgi:hypothetical protein|nr:hypothetical protein [Pseudomonadota bacterium]
MLIFIATSIEDVPDECRVFASVDGSVPGAAATWDHHRSGEIINLDAMPEHLEPREFDGVGTTMADMDAAASVVVFLLGGCAAVPAAARAVLESASHWCDHLGPHPSHGNQTNRLGRGLRDAFDTELAATSGREGAVFENFCRLLLMCIQEGRTLPFRHTDQDIQRHKAKSAYKAGRLRTIGGVAIADMRGLGEIDPLVLYEMHEQPIGVFVETHKSGGRQYTIGTNPFVGTRPDDLTVALKALAAAEFRHGPPCLAEEPVPGSENWGGRKTVFGSPWNYGSRLEPEEVAQVAAEALGLPWPSE